MEPIKAYKGFGGYKQTDNEDEVTHIIMTVDDYKALTGELQHAKSSSEEWQQKYESMKREANRYRSAYGNAVKQLDTMKFYVNSAEQKNQLADEKIARADASVKNNQRMVKEMTNKARNIPQRAPGYVVLKTEEAFDDHTRVGWRTVIQTPWPDQMDVYDDYNGVLALCRQDHFGGMVDDMYTRDENRTASFSDRWRHAQQAAAEGKICAIELRFASDPRTHLWNVVVFHSGFLRPGRGGRKPKDKQQNTQTQQQAPQPALQPVQTPGQHRGGMHM